MDGAEKSYASKEELKAVSVVYGLKVSLGRVPRSSCEKGKESYSDRYLSRWHQDNPG